MSDLKLFKTDGSSVTELRGHSVAVEKSLQDLIEKDLEIFLSVRFLASEYSTGQRHRGRIDTLGIDENGSPVIIEYKRSLNENVINQGLYYLDWLLDHKGEFTLLVQKKYGQEPADSIDGSGPRLLCIAGDFTKYDEHAVQQMNRNIELLRYRRYGDGLLLLELVNAAQAEPIKDSLGKPNREGSNREKPQQKTFAEILSQSQALVRDRYEALKAFVLALGDDVLMKETMYYVAFRKLKTFACVTIRHGSGDILVIVNLDPTNVKLEPDFTRDISDSVGWWMDLEIRIKSDEDLKKAKELIIRSYELT